MMFSTRRLLVNHTIPVTACTPEPWPWALVATKVVVIVLMAIFALYALHLGHNLTAAVAAAAGLGCAAAETVRRLRVR
mgnify:CR=1 FL=1